MTPGQEMAVTMYDIYGQLERLKKLYPGRDVGIDQQVGSWRSDVAEYWVYVKGGKSLFLDSFTEVVAEIDRRVILFRNFREG